MAARRSSVLLGRFCREALFDEHFEGQSDGVYGSQGVRQDGNRKEPIGRDGRFTGSAQYVFKNIIL